MSFTLNYKQLNTGMTYITSLATNLNASLVGSSNSSSETTSIVNMFNELMLVINNK